MAVPRISLLSQADKDRIHGRSLDVLEQVGIHFGSEQAISILEEAGCPVNRGELSAKIPPHVVEKALETLPSQFLLAAREPGQDILCGDGNLYYTAAGQGLWFRDLETRQRRPSTTADLIQCVRLIDALDGVQENCAMVAPLDLPPMLQELKCLQVSLQETTKHFLGGGTDLEVVAYGMRMLEALLGDLDRLRERPIFSAVINPVSPLQNRGELVDCTLAWAPYRVPIFLQFLPLAGATAPVSLAGTVLLANAEFLGNMTLYQLAEPGWPTIWALAAGSVDMRSGRWVFGPEGVLMTLSLIEMAKYYGVPCNSWGHCSTEAKVIGFQAGIEGTPPGLVAALAGVDNMWGPADLDGATLMDLPFILLATEVMRQTGRLVEGMAFDEEQFLYDVLASMRFQGEYLGDPSTKKHFRREHLLPVLFPRESYESWASRGESEEEMAMSRVEEILRTHEPQPLPDDVNKVLDQIMAAAKKDLVN